MADTSSVGESAATLAAFLMYVPDNEDVRRRMWRRTAAAAAVAVLHVAFVIFLIESEWVFHHQHTTPRAVPPLLWLLLPRAPTSPNVTTPRKDRLAPHETPMTSITPIVKQPPPEEAINPAWALGQALACGASNYAYLTPLARSQCKRPPWHYKYDRDGYIVLDTSQQRRPQEEEKPHPGDIQAHERGTADPCLVAKAAGTECADQIIFGNTR